MGGCVGVESGWGIEFWGVRSALLTEALLRERCLCPGCG